MEIGQKWTSKSEEGVESEPASEVSAYQIPSHLFLSFDSEVRRQGTGWPFVIPFHPNLLYSIPNKSYLCASDLLQIIVRLHS